MELNISTAKFCYDNHFYNNCDEFLRQNFPLKQELFDFVDELKKQYPVLIYTYE